MSKLQLGINEIHNSVIQYVLELLQTGIFRNKDVNAYMKAYR
jgi:hypothetical protein